MSMQTGKRGFTLIELLACQPKPWRRQVRSGFTLIELLAVIAIIGVLFAVAMPVFENLGRKDTERAAFQFMTTVRLARQHAVNRRQWTLVVIPTRVGGPYAPEDLDKCLRGYAVLGVTNRVDHLSRDEQNPSNMQFEFISDWRFLPEGIYFDDRRRPGDVDNTILDRLFSPTYQFPLRPGPNPPTRPMAVIMFKPNGQAYTLTPNRFATGIDIIVHITAARYYERVGNQLADPIDIPGTSTMVRIVSKSGQIEIRPPN